MASTDDIAREVVNILLEQVLKGAGMAVDVAPKAWKGLKDFASVNISQLTEMIKRDQEFKKMANTEGEISVAQMNEYIRRFSERSSSFSVGDADAKDYDQLLKEQGVVYAKWDMKDDNCKQYMVLNKDLEKVENATKILMARRGQVTELNAKLYFNSLSPDQVHVVEGLSAAEMELFRHYAREQGLLFTVITKREGDMVVCSKKDIKKARRALLNTGWALTSANGAKIREQIEYRLEGRTAINIAAEEGQRELYIVSRNDPSQFVHISSEDYAVYKHNKQISTSSRSDPDFYAKCISSCEGLIHPVVMSAEQFYAGFTQDELQNAPTIDLFPEGYDDQMEMDEVNRLINLVALKSGLDNEHNATWGLWDPSVSYAEFAAYENIQDQEEREGREYTFNHFKKAAFYSQDNHDSYDVDMKEKSVDYIIAKAEEKRRQQAGEPEHTQSRTLWPFGGTRHEEDERQQ